MMIEIPPGWVVIAGAFIIAISRGILRHIAMLGLPLLAMFMIWAIPMDAEWHIQFLVYRLSLLDFTVVGKLFATVFALMTFVGGIFAMRTASTLELSAAFLYAGSAIGITSCGDLITLFIYWELMALGSTAVILASGTDSAYRASMRYLLMHAFGGTVLLTGIEWHLYSTGSAEFTQLEIQGPAQWLILIGFLVNVGAPPFSALIADAYP